MWKWQIFSINNIYGIRRLIKVLALYQRLKLKIQLSTDIKKKKHFNWTSIQQSYRDCKYFSSYKFFKTVCLGDSYISSDYLFSWNIFLFMLSKLRLTDSFDAREHFCSTFSVEIILKCAQQFMYENKFIYNIIFFIQQRLDQHSINTTDFTVYILIKICIYKL